MSRGRSRSWRPDRKSGGKQSRQRTIMILIAGLVGLVGLLIIPTMFSSPNFRTALMLPQSKTQPTAPFTVLRSASNAGGAHDLERLFQDLQTRNPRQVGEVTTVQLLADLASAAKPSEKLLLYCGLEPLIVYNEAPEVQLWDGGKKQISFPKLLTALSKLQASQIILVMDFLQRDTGIANGRLSDDAIPLMKASIDAAKMRELAVIFPYESSQRNWESLVTSMVSVEDTTEVNSISEPAIGNRSNGLGTVMTNSLLETFEKGRYTSLNQLFESIRDGVSDRVQKQYGQTQTIQLYPPNSPLRDSELLVRAEELPSLKSDADTRSTEPATDTDGSVVGDEVKGLKKNNAISPATTSQTRLAELRETRMNLAKSGEALATNPVEWTQLALAISSVRLDLIYGHKDSAYFDQANELVGKIHFNLNDVKTAKSEMSFAPWLTLSNPDDLSLSTDRLKLFTHAFNSLKQEQPTEGLSFELQSSETRLQFADWIVDEIGTLSKSLDIQADSLKQRKKLMEWQRFINHLADDWAQSDWPESLFTIHEILSQSTGGQTVESVRTLQDLLRLRRRTLECATGTLDGSTRFRQSVWRKVSESLKSLLIDLTAAESWLALGPEGLAKSQQKLEVAKKKWEKVESELKSQHAISVLSDLQQTEIPFLIQFLAQQQEEVDITDEELKVASDVADDILAGLNTSSDQFSPGTHAKTGLSSSEIQAMFQLTRNLATTPAEDSDLAHLTTLRDYVSSRVTSGAKGIEGRRLAALATSDLSMADCVSLLGRGSGSDTLSGQGHTGLRLSSWSIRLLDSVSGTTHANLWRLWKSLIKAIQDDEVVAVRAARTQLAVGIADAWKKFRSQPIDASAADLFVTQQMASKLLANDLAHRINAQTPNAKIYRRIYEDRFVHGASVADAEEQQDWIESETQIGAENTAVVKLNTEADRIYVQDRAFEPPVQWSQQLGWYRFDNPRLVSELELSVPNSATESRVLKIVLTNKHDVVFASQNLTVYPNAEAAWEITVVEAGRPLVFTDGRDLLTDGRYFKLPPSTRSAKGKDAPIPLNFRIKKVNGAALRANVKMFAIRIDGTEQSMGTRQVDFSASDTVLIPFAPQVPKVETIEPKVDSLAAGSGAAIDVQGGIRLDVTPDIRGATTTSITIRPIIANAAEYVETPKIKYDSEEQKLTIGVTKKQNVASLSPNELPLEVHFNPLLAEMLQLDLLGTKRPNLQDEMSSFEFAFSDELQSLLGGVNDLEFAMSVAGISHAWRWRLEEDRVTLIAPDDPVVRMELSLQNPKEDSHSV